jgi:hypothetical protein
VRTDRDILGSAARAVAAQAAKVDAVVSEAIDAGLDGSDPITVAVKMVQVELLRVKGELERQLARLVLRLRPAGSLGTGRGLNDRTLVASRTSAAW